MRGDSRREKVKGHNDHASADGRPLAQRLVDGVESEGIARLGRNYVTGRRRYMSNVQLTIVAARDGYNLCRCGR
jgi:hypothetical protein